MLSVKLSKYLLFFMVSEGDVCCFFENFLEIILSFVVGGLKLIFLWNKFCTLNLHLFGTERVKESRLH